MAEEHPNVRTVREGFEALDRGDMNWMTEHMSDDIVWHVGGKSKVAGEYRGKEAVMNLFARQSQMLGASKIDLHDVVGNDQHVIAIGRASVDDPGGGTVSWLYANVFHIENGITKEVWGLADETSESDALIDKMIS
ncbi:MAG TPA: nuclear transport factor 2 family protein [Actinomycetota bacterium]